VLGWLKLAKRVSELEDQMLKLARVVSDRDLDWTDMRARCKRLLDRTEKAAARMESGVESGQEQGLSGQSEGLTGANGRTLTPAQAILQTKILSRRRLTS
jgi:hypothetical protein